MAAARHNPTRRALLGAAVALPAILGGRAVAAQAAGGADRAKWDRALTAYRRAEAAVGAFRVREYHPAHLAFAAVRDRWSMPYDFTADREAWAAVSAAMADFEPVEDRINDLESAQTAALKRLLRIPAPDLPALALKIELIVDQDVATLDGGERCLAVLKADGQRLAGAD
jgi:hypothetical protein